MYAQTRVCLYTHYIEHRIVCVHTHKMCICSSKVNLHQNFHFVRITTWLGLVQAGFFMLLEQEWNYYLPCLVTNSMRCPLTIKANVFWVFRHTIKVCVSSLNDVLGHPCQTQHNWFCLCLSFVRKDLFQSRALEGGCVSSKKPFNSPRQRSSWYEGWENYTAINH